ncbi:MULTISPECIES: maleate cis-trans isomerase family protein [Nocardia]|jgi:maleate isomerase|uniref:Arylmalonate decarboxylase n=2 Tax=Nocardia TaxID=1817 RepID=A0A2T2YTE3_9NOCA|nr:MULTISPECIES: arylmalonate decarboxylase [Nocardia]MBF6447768.1 arylmalonate decarboxylase [Nocardia elegans]PSR58792.1 arylmalonate decarboxylase [Nocardia nova]
MPDVLGWRAKFGVLAPSTNTVVEPDFARLGVPGVTAHFGRIHIRDQDMSDDAGMGRLLEQIRDEIVAACERVLTCEPDYMVMGMSAETFWGGVEGNRRFVRQIHEVTGLEVATGAEACRRALALYGARRIGVVTPYQPVGDENVVRFFGELGFEVKAIKGLRCPTAVSIAHVTEDELRSALREVDGDGVDALVQCGTNLSMVRLADEAERWLGKPVLAINAATWWMALRDNGFTDRIEGAGSLLRDH